MESGAPEKKFLSVEAFASKHGLSRGFVRGLIKDKQIDVVRLARGESRGRILIPEDALGVLLEKQKRASTQKQVG